MNIDEVKDKDFILVLRRVLFSTAQRYLQISNAIDNIRLKRIHASRQSQEVELGSAVEQ
jgi:hypothetical protein